ncbi:MAG: cation:proton antiporter [Pseudomonas sp.]|nr:cation:proton antiporter [Pseudomonas sp.]
MHQLDLAFTVMGLAVVAIALLSAAIHRNPLSEPILAMAVGIAVGPYGFGWLELARWGNDTMILEQASRLTLAIGLMGVALRLQRESVQRLLRPVGLLLTLGMLGMWLVSSMLAWWVLPVPLWAALLLGAIVTPTDPVVASAIVTGNFADHHLPLRLRDGLSFESGANDGLAYLLVMLPVLMLGHAPTTAWLTWLLESLLIGVLLAALIGWVIGYGAARLLRLAEHHGLVETTSLLGYTLAFSIFSLGAASLLNADAIVSVFVAGLTFNLCSERNEEHEEEKIQEGVAKLFALPMFVIFGIALPFDAWASLGWPLAALAVLILLLRRAPVIGALAPFMRSSWNHNDTRFLGWFAPIGIAAIYYASLAEKHTGDPLYWHVASALVFASVIVHGVTAGPLTRLYSRSSE